MHFKLLFLIFAMILTDSLQTGATYYKDYYESSQIKSEGWIENNQEKGYWKFYYESGRISAQGHYKDNKREKYWYFYNPNGIKSKEGNYVQGHMTKWWLFYDAKGKISHKCQLSNGRKNGYCLKYKNEELVSAEKYRNGKKIKEWFNFIDFQRENKLSDLK